MENTLNPALSELLIPGTDEDVIAHYATLSSRAHDESFGLVEDEYAILDTETTGFSVERDQLIEIAAAIMRGPEIVARFSTYVNPGTSIPIHIQELTHITDEDVKGAPNPTAAVAELIAFVGERDVVAHNAPFDKAFICASAPYGSYLTERSAWLDSVELARIALPRLKAHNMAALSQAFDAPASTHRATADVEALCVVWRVLLVALSDLPVGMLAYIADIFPKTEWPLRKVFRQIALRDPTEQFSLPRIRDERMKAFEPRQKIDADGLNGIYRIPGEEEIVREFSPAGIAGRMYNAYEPRDEQVSMACEVVKAFETSTHRAIEAGTGVGKSVAYLLPQALLAKRNNVICGVATKSNALLDQLVYHELPLLSRSVEGGIQYVALKGYDHYPCLRKLMRFAGEDLRFDTTAPPVMVAMLLTYVAQSSQGDLDALSLYWKDLPRNEICASAEDCLHHKCNYYSRCLLHGARKMARSADIVVTNHALFFCDIMADGGILPPIRHWVVDEAHSVETEARRQLSPTVGARTLFTVLDALVSSNGTLALLRRKATTLDGGAVLVGMLTGAEKEARAIQVITESFFSFVKDLSELAETSSYEWVDLWINDRVRDSGAWGVVASTGSALSKRLETLWTTCRDVVSYSEQFPDLLESQGDLAGLAARINEIRCAIDLILDGTQSDYVYSAELCRREDVQGEKLVASRIDIGAVLIEGLYPNVKSVIYTSATIATGESFDYFARAAGLDRLSPEQWSSRRLSSSYDFENNMTVYLPTDISEPSAPAYKSDLEQLLFTIHVAMGGSVLTLFTNRREMEYLYERLEKRLRERNIEVICQSRGYSAKRLRDEFLSDEHLSLFALRSFWEGFDAVGDTLRCVIIPKLPFGRPNDPLSCERRLREKDAWRRYALPEAIIDMKQAAGRLIRSSTDRGCLILADNRLLTKRYGNAFLKALPTQKRFIMDSDAIADAIHKAYGSNDLNS